MRWTLSKRLYAALAVAATLLTVSVLITYQKLHQLEELQIQSDHQQESLLLGSNLLLSQVHAASSFRGYLIERAPNHLESIRLELAKQDELFSALRKDNADDPDSMTRLDELKNTFLKYHRDTVEPAIALIQAGKAPSNKVGLSIRQDLLPIYERFAAHEKDQAVQLKAQSQQLRSEARRWSLLATLLALIAGGGLVGLTMRKAGRDIGESVATVSSSTSQIAATVTEQERILADQSSAMSEIASTMAELQATSAQANDFGEEIVRRSSASVESARHSGSAIQANAEEMAGLRETVEGIARQILDLSEQTGQIGTILGAVSDIAGQTNLLALNAAVEAARAGEHGRGFSVVAAEIRKLADQSKRSLDQIGGLVAQIQKATNTTVLAAEQGSKRVEATIRAAEDSGAAVGGLVASLEEMVQNTQQIVLNLRQQAVGIRQINEAVGGLNAGIRESLQGVGQVRGGIQQLTGLNHSLATLL